MKALVHRFVALLSLGFSVPCLGAAAEASSAPAADVASAKSAAARAALEAALGRDDLPAAWMAVREWRQAAPADPALHLALAEVYLRLQAPAAAIVPVNKALAANPALPAPLARSLLATKARAHLAVEEWGPAWNALSRLVEGHGGSDESDPLIAMARRARWEAFANASAATAWERFLSRAADSASAPDAPPIAQVRLARWLVATDAHERAIEYLREKIAARPGERELVRELAELVLAELAVRTLEELPAALERRQTELELVRSSPGTSPLTLFALEGLRARGAGTTAEVPLVAPRDFLATTENIVAGLAKRRADYARALAESIDALRVLRDEPPDWETAATRPNAEGLAEREAKALARAQTLVQAELTAIRTRRLVDFLAQETGRRADALQAASPQDPTLPALRRLAATLAEMNRPNAAETELLDEAGYARETLPALAVSYNRLRVRIAADAALAQAVAPAEIYAATEDMLAVDDTSREVWRRRFVAAQQAGDRAEAIASGARLFVADWSRATAALDQPLPPAAGQLLRDLEELAAANDALFAQARSAWEAGQAETAFARLDAVLAADPVHAAAWRLRGQWCEMMDDDDGAVQALERWWRLDDAAAWNPSAAMNLAARTGEWDLLFAIADARLNADPADTEAHTFRVVAGIACDRLQAAQSSVPMLRMSLTPQTGLELDAIVRTLITPHSVIPLIQIPGEAFALASQPDRPPALPVWLAYYEHLKRDRQPKAGPPEFDPADPQTLHRQRLEGRLSPTAYLAKTAGTPEEPIAQWVSLMLARGIGKSDEVTARAADTAADTRLPLSLRAVARRIVVMDSDAQPVASFRASDTHYSKRRAAGDRWWGAPGQEVAPGSFVDLKEIPPDLPVRLRGIGESVTTRVSFGNAPKVGLVPRLWELREIVVGNSMGYAPGGVSAPFILDCSDSRIFMSSVVIEGAAFLERTELAARLTVRPGARLEWHEPLGSLLSAEVAGRLTVFGGALDFKGPSTVLASGRVSIQGTRLEGQLPFKLAAGAEAVWRDVRAIGHVDWPTESGAGWTLDDVRIAAPLPGAATAVLPLPAPHRGAINVLAAPQAAPTVRASTIDELRAVLQTARPGTVIELAAGEHVLPAPIDVPAGVTLVGATPCTLIMNRGSPVAFRFHSGAARIQGFHTRVQEIPGPRPNMLVEDRVPKTAITVASPAWAIVSSARFEGWTHNQHTAVTAAPGSLLDLNSVQFDLQARHRIDPAARVTKFPLPPPDRVAAQAGEIAARTYRELCDQAAARFAREIGAATNREARQDAAWTLANNVGTAGLRTGMSRPATARTLMTILLPMLHRFPVESPYLYGAAHHYHANDSDVKRAMLPAELKPHFERFSQGVMLALVHDAKANVAYDFLQRYPPGSPGYAAAIDALRRGLTPAELDAEVAAKKKRAVELAAAREAQRLADKKRLAEEMKRSAVFAQRAPAPSSGGYRGSSAPRAFSPPPMPPAWKPSSSQQMSNYRHNLNVQISRAVGKAW